MVLTAKKPPLLATERNVALRAPLAGMPRFYFDLRENGNFIEDEAGTVLPDIDAAQQEAERGITEMALHKLSDSGLRHMTIDVRRDNGDAVLSVTLTLNVTRSSQRTSKKRRDKSGDTGQGAGPP